MSKGASTMARPAPALPTVVGRTGPYRELLRAWHAHKAESIARYGKAFPRAKRPRDKWANAQRRKHAGLYDLIVDAMYGGWIDGGGVSSLGGERWRFTPHGNTSQEYETAEECQAALLDYLGVHGVAAEAVAA